MFCKQCGTQVPDGERFCPNCGSQMMTPQHPGAPVRRTNPRKKAKGFAIGGLKFSLAQLFACFASFIGILAFIFYFLAPRKIEAGTATQSVSFSTFFKGTDYTGFFYVIGAVFTFIAIALIALPLVLQLLNKNDEGEFEIPLFSFALYLIAFFINIITTGTLNKMLQGVGKVTFGHVLYIIFSILFFAYCVFSAIMAFKANGNRIKITLLGYTLFEQK